MAADPKSCEYLTLWNGTKMPAIFLGTWKSEPGKAGEAVKAAVKAGYRAIDTANDYGNEAEIGKALKELFAEGVVKREDMFIQSKLWNTNHRKELVRPDLEATLKDLQLSYVDSFVIHWPQASPSAGKLAVAASGNLAAHHSKGTMFPLQDDGRYSVDKDCHFTETWAAMEDLVDAGLAKTVGLSNFNARQVEEVLASVKKYRPAINQCECHPYLQQKDLVDLCHNNKIVFQAYSPLGSRDRPNAKPTDPELLEDPAILEIAERAKKSPAQVVIRWHLQAGHSLCPKSVTPERIAQNYQVFDFSLSHDEMKNFDKFNRGWRHLLVPATAGHPDYPFWDSLPPGFEVPVAPKDTGSKN